MIGNKTSYYCLSHTVWTFVHEHSLNKSESSNLTYMKMFGNGVDNITDTNYNFDLSND